MIVFRLIALHQILKFFGSDIPNFIKRGLYGLWMENYKKGGD